MKTPLTYYGGKINMVKDILPLLPKHSIYCEPFVGGGAIFWAKKHSPLEVLNDNNGILITFYQVLKNNFDELKKLIDQTLYSRLTVRCALQIYHCPHLFTKLQIAWAFWTVVTQGFSGVIGGWSYDNRGKKNICLKNKKLRFTKELGERLENVQLECIDALKLIQKRDSEHTFFYVDPPYVGANQGHYGGYTSEHFESLLAILSEIKGTFLLSSYSHPVLDEYIQRYGWKSKTIEKVMTASKSSQKRGKKVEVLTWNY